VDLTTLNQADLIGMAVASMLTLFIFSYVAGDNPLFRLAVHLFIGVACGLAAASAWNNILYPQVILPLISGSLVERLLALLPLVFAVLLVWRVFRPEDALSRTPLAYLVGIGAAVSLGGAILGTLLPQVQAAGDSFAAQASAGLGPASWMGWLDAVLLLGGTLVTLLAFQHSRLRRGKEAAQPAWLQSISAPGKIFIALALGVVFAALLRSALTALVERVSTLFDFILSLVG
jgi:hypothetical protein